MARINASPLNVLTIRTERPLQTYRQAEIQSVQSQHSTALQGLPLQALRYSMSVVNSVM
jgi:hypothetical protein